MSESAEVINLLKNRTEYLKHLHADLSKTAEASTNAQKTIDKFDDTITTMKTLSEKVEHESFIQLGARIYVPGVIKHTNEYYFDHTAFPNSYFTYSTLNQTVNLLENRKNREGANLAKIEKQAIQIEERIKMLEIKEPETEKIVSDRGVAVKVGDFYEIVEFEP